MGVSCVKDQEDIFDKPSSERLAATLAETQKILTSADIGWVMYYYPNGFGGAFGTQGMGGYMFTMKFTESEVTVWSEIMSGSSTSLYRMTSDNGPVISFDTFNKHFHYFATPSGSSPNEYGDTGRYQGYKGDFEFTIISATPEEVVLKGKRTNNYFKMYPATRSLDSYYADIDRISYEIYVSIFEGKVASQDVTMKLDLSARNAVFSIPETVDGTEEGESVTVDKTIAQMAFALTDKGIKFYQPVEIDGVVLDEMVWDKASVTLSSGDVTLKGSLPAYWRSYSDFLGNYKLTYNKTATLDITIKKDVEDQSFLISGISTAYDIKAGYNRSEGTISILAQVVGREEDNSYYYQLAGWDCDMGYVTYTATNGVIGYWTPDSDPMVVTFADNRGWLSYSVNGFIIYQFTGAGTRVGGAPEAWRFANGSYQLPYFASITKQ